MNENRRSRAESELQLARRLKAEHGANTGQYVVDRIQAAVRGGRDAEAQLFDRVMKILSTY